MPSSLPDVELAPAEGTPPPGQVVQPTDFGLERGSQELASAATVGFRAGAIATRAQALEDERAVAGPIDTLKGRLQANADEEKAGYQGEPGLGARMGAAGQFIYQDALASAQKTMTPGQLNQFERKGQDLLAEHQSLSETIQGAHQATAIGDAVKSQQSAQAQALALPALSDLRTLDAGLRQNAAGDPNSITQYKTAAQALAQQRFEEGTANMPSWQVQNIAPAYWNAVQKEISEGSQRLGDAVTTYAMATAQDAHQQNVQTMIGGINSHPETYPSVIASPQWNQAQAALGTTPEAQVLREKNERDAAKAHLGGLEANQDWDVLNAQLQGHDFDFLGEEKQPFVNDALKHGENAIDNATKIATLKNLWTDNVTYHATQGPEGIISPEDLNFLRNNMEPREFGELLARTEAADKVFAAIGGPIADQKADKLGAIKDADPALLKTDPINYEAQHTAYEAAQAQLKSLSDDPAAAMWGVQKNAGKVRKSGPPQPGSVDGMGPRLESEWQPLAGIFATDPKNPTAAPQANPKAGATYFNDIITGEYTNDASLLTAGQLRALPKTLAAQIATNYNDAVAREPQSAYLQAQRLVALVQSAPDEVKLPDGHTVAGKALLAGDLLEGGLKEKGLISAVLQAASGTTAGTTALQLYVASRTNPELVKPLQTKDANVLLNGVVKGLGGLTSSMGGPADLKFNQDRIDEGYAIARQLMHRYGYSAGVAAQNATSLMTQDFRFGAGIRMPVGQANQLYDAPFEQQSLATQAATAAGMVFGGRVGAPKQSGWDLAASGRDQAKAYALANDGANLMLPPDQRAAGVTLKAYRDIVAQNGRWVNFGDGAWGYAMQLNTGQYSLVQDKYGRPIMLDSGQAIKDGQAGASSFLKPATPLQTTTTPAGHPNHAVPPAQAAAAAGHAIATDTVGKSRPANENAAAPPAAPPPPAPAGAAQPPTLTEKQALLKNANITDPRVLSLFSGQPTAPVAAPTASAADTGGGGGGGDVSIVHIPPSHAGAQFDRLNLTPAQALTMFSPGVIHQEHGGPGVVSPAGAMGLMQIRPTTAAIYAAKLGIPYDEQRLLNDNAYNQQIGTAILNDAFQRRMVGKNPMAGIAVALAEYNAGPGNVDGHTVHGHYQPGYLQKYGDPRSGDITVDQWIDKLPADKWGEPRDYVRKIYAMTAERLAAVHGAGPAPAPAPAAATASAGRPTSAAMGDTWNIRPGG